MKKKIALLCMFSLVCTMLFAACGNKNEENNNQNKSDNDSIQVETNLPDDYIVEIEQEDVVTGQPEADLPDPEAALALTSISSTEGLEIGSTISVHADGALHLLTSSMDLASVGIYETDLTEGIEYNASMPLGFCQNVKANEYVSIAINIPESEIPSLLLVAEEHSGALGKYLLCLDGFNSAYLVPVLE